MASGECSYSPDCTRPISVVDASNRILASIFRVALDRCVGDRVSAMQRGFLTGRPMLRNDIEIDWAAQKISLLSNTGAILLFDFRAAFPSMNHAFMWKSLEAMGIPGKVINATRMFYHDNAHILKIAGSRYDGPKMQSGVRQGCPLSGCFSEVFGLPPRL